MASRLKAPYQDFISLQYSMLYRLQEDVDCVRPGSLSIVLREMGHYLISLISNLYNSNLCLVSL